MIHSLHAANIYMSLANIMWHYGKDFTTKLSIIKALAKTTVYFSTFLKLQWLLSYIIRVTTAAIDL